MRKMRLRDIVPVPYMHVFWSNKGYYGIMWDDGSTSHWSFSTQEQKVEREVCEGCGAEIDPDTCGCGDCRKGHDTLWIGHSFVPMGCNCFRSPKRELQQVLADALADSQAQRPGDANG